ncbi:MAG TPA: hypothetical protein VFQ88_14160 [Nevskiaceae bacterium]|nr:hypothetical protein [Nevskiaceae bacterium]
MALQVAPVQEFDVDALPDADACALTFHYLDSILAKETTASPHLALNAQQLRDLIDYLLKAERVLAKRCAQPHETQTPDSGARH